MTTTSRPCFVLVCVDCMLEIIKRQAPAIIAYFDSRLRAWVCPLCWQERKDREEREQEQEAIT